MALIAMLLVGALSLHPARPVLVLGRDASTEILVDASTPLSGLRLSVNVGSVAPLREVSAGHFSATYTPPAKRFPQVAIFLLEGPQGEHQWSVLALHGVETLSLDTKPNAQVTVQIGNLNNQLFGPTKADKKGRAKVAVVVPPGVATAWVRSVDLAGNRKEVSVPLDPPPFVRTRAALIDKRASWSDAVPAKIEVFALDAEARPSAQQTVAAAASVGVLSPASALGAGVFTLSYRAPDVFTGDAATLTIEDCSVAMPLIAGPPAAIDVVLEPPQIASGDAAHVQVLARVKDSKGNVVADAKPTLSATFGTLSQTQLDLPEDTKGQREISVVATLESLKAEARLKVSAPLATRGDLEVGQGLVRAGGPPIVARLKLFDRFGNAVLGAQLEGVSPPGEDDPAQENPPGTYRVSRRVSAGEGPAKLSVRTKDGQLTVSAPISVLPELKSWGVGVGIFAGANMNFGRLLGLVGSLELAVRPLFWPVEFVLGGGFRYYIPPSGLLGDSAVKTTLLGAPITLGARLNVPVSLLVSLIFSLNGGVQPTWSTLEVGGLKQSGFFAAPVAGASAGLSVRAGPGRFIADVSWQLVYGTGDVSGNLGGFGLRVGYLYDAR